MDYMNIVQPFVVELTDDLLSKLSLGISLLSAVISIVALAISARQVFLRPCISSADAYLLGVSGRQPFAFYFRLNVYNPSSRSKCVTNIEVVDGRVRLVNTVRYGHYLRQVWAKPDAECPSLAPMDASTFYLLRASSLERAPDWENISLVESSTLPFIVPPYETAAVWFAFAPGPDSYIANTVAQKSGELEEKWNAYINCESFADTSLPDIALPLRLCIRTSSIMLGRHSFERDQFVEVRFFPIGHTEKIFSVIQP